MCAQIDPDVEVASHNHAIMGLDLGRGTWHTCRPNILFILVSGLSVG